jgi:predicted dehydrogenase
MEASNLAPLRVGVIGVGNWAKHGHLRVLDLLPQFTLQAVYSHRREAAEAAASAYRISRVAASIDELIDSPDIDLVVVLNTAPQHARTVKRVIAAGKHVYCEWPLTTTLDESSELLRLAQARGVRHVVGLQRRLAPHNRYVRDLIEQGYVGELRSVRMHVSMNYFQALRTRALEWTVPPENFSSVVSIYGGHFLDMLFSATGWPVSLAALTPNQFPSVTIKETGVSIPTSTPDQLVLTSQDRKGICASRTCPHSAMRATTMKLSARMATGYRSNGSLCPRITRACLNRRCLRRCWSWPSFTGPTRTMWRMACAPRRLSPMPCGCMI